MTATAHSAGAGLRSRAGRAGAWWLARPHTAAACLFAVLSLLMVGQGLLPGRTLSSSDLLYAHVPWAAGRPADVKGLGSNFELADAAVVFQPFLQYARAQLPGIPLWNPHLSAGRPFLANAQNAIFSPFTWPAFIVPFWKSLAVIAALKLFVAAFGMYVLARTLGQRWGGAMAAGTVFAFGTFFIVWIAWPLTNIFPLLPWLFVLSELIVRRPRVLPAAGLALVVALTFFGGHPETTFHSLFATSCFFLFRLVTRDGARAAGLRGLARPLGTFAAAALAGAAIAAVLVIPFAELLLHSGDLARREGQNSGFWPTKYLGALFLHDYWGRATQGSNIEPFMTVRGWYAGAITLMLASAALLIRPTRLRIGIALFAAFSASMVVGRGPVFRLLTQHVPGFDTAHNQRMLIFVLMALALLAGYGLDELARRGPVRRRALVLGSAGVIFLVPFVWMAAAGTITSNGLGTALKVAWGFADPPPVSPLDTSGVASDIVRMSALLQWIPLAGAGLALIALRMRRVRPLAAATFVGVALALLAVDLFRANLGFNSSIPIDRARMAQTGAITYLQGRRPNRFVGLSPDFSFQPLPPDTAMQWGLYDARGYDYPAEKRYDRMWRRNVAPGIGDFTQPIVLATATPAAIRALNLLSVGDLLQAPTDKPLREPGLRVAYRGADAVVYRNANALPRTFLVERQQPLKSADAQLAAATAPGFDGRRVAVTERAIPGLAQATGPAVGVGGSTRLAHYGAERVAVDTDARRRSLMVLTDVYYPGWKAEVDGRPARIERVDYLLRGVVVPKGRHRVELRYQPSSFRAGWIISVVALLGVLGAGGAALLARRRERAAS